MTSQKNFNIKFPMKVQFTHVTLNRGIEPRLYQRLTLYHT
nr:MAG TPA: hypothetical protein [Caudoviricetes sp.]